MKLFVKMFWVLSPAKQYKFVTFYHKNENNATIFTNLWRKNEKFTFFARVWTVGEISPRKKMHLFLLAIFGVYMV